MLRLELVSGQRRERVARYPALAPVPGATPKPPRLVIASDDLERITGAGRELSRVIGADDDRVAHAGRKVARGHPPCTLRGRHEDERRPLVVAPADHDSIPDGELQRSPFRDRMSHDRDDPGRMHRADLFFRHGAARPR